MKVKIRDFEDHDIAEVVDLSLLAWKPVFASFQKILGQSIYAIIWPDWKKSQKDGIETVCRDAEKYHVLVAEAEGGVIGFVAYTLDFESKTGEIILLAVHPKNQNHGVGTELNQAALSKMKENGMQLAKVETGGDPAHAPARKAYEKAGFTGLPLVRYFQDL